MLSVVSNGSACEKFAKICKEKLETVPFCECQQFLGIGRNGE